MKIGIFGKRVQRERPHLGMMAAGLKAHNIDVKVEDDGNYDVCDLAIIWGHRYGRIIETQKRHGKDYLVMECGFLGDRVDFTSLGFNGLNGNAVFYRSGDPARGKQFHDQIKPWSGGDYYLISGQVAGDASLEGVDYQQWVNSLPTEHNGLPVFFRPHPLGCSYQVKHKFMDGPLVESLAGAAAVWIWNSNSGVDALLAGTQVMTANKGAMTYPVATHCIHDQHATWCDREKFVNELAWCQWKLKEIENGTAWDHLKQRYE